MTKTMGTKLLLWLSGAAFLAITTLAAQRSPTLHVALMIVLLPVLLKANIAQEHATRYWQRTYRILGALVCAALGYHFYYTWQSLNTIQAIAGRLGIGVKCLLAAAAIPTALLAVPFAAYCLGWLAETKVGPRVAALENPMSDKKLFAGLMAVYLVALYPMLRISYNYNDDLGRMMYGYADFGYFRHVSDLLSHIVHSGEYLNDIAPLPQLLAAAALVLASVILVKQMGEGSTLWSLAAVIPLGLNPYFLSCLSYKFDSPYMALSVLASVAPLCFREKKRAVYLGSITACMLVVCMTYQAASGIFPMCVLFLVYRMWCRGESLKEIGKFAAASAAAYLAGVGFFAMFIMVPVNNYVSNSMGTVERIAENYRTFFTLFISDFKAYWLFLLGALVLWFIAASVGESKHKKSLTLCTAVVVVCLMFLLSFGLYPALSKPLTAPRAMFGVGTFAALLALGNPAMGKERFVTRTLAVCLAWAFVTFSCSYGNALASQNKYAEFRIQEVVQSLANLEEFKAEDSKTVHVEGNIGFARAIQNSPENELLERMVPLHFYGPGVVWGIRELVDSYDLGAREAIYYDSEEPYQNWEMLHDNIYHTIYGKGNAFVVELKQ